MHEAVIDNEKDMARILDACEKGGHSQVAALSTTGLTEPRVRITILPNTAFKSGGTPLKKDEWLQSFKEMWKPELQSTDA